MPVYLTDGRSGLTLVSKECEGAYLIHYRTPGSKNGMRLYQYKDGSLTPLGRIHYGIGQKKISRLDKKISDSNEMAKNASGYADVFMINKHNIADDTDAESKSAYESLDKFEKSFRENARMYKDKSDKLTAKRDKLQAELDQLSGKSSSEEQEKINARRQIEGALLDKTKSYEQMSTQEKHKFGNDLLKQVNETMSEIDSRLKDKSYDPYKDNGYEEYDKLTRWIDDQIYEKSGSWNGEYFHKGSNAEKAYPAVDKSYHASWDREDKIKQEIGYDSTIRWGTPGYKREQDRLMKALKEDSTWNSIEKDCRKAESDLAGAMLRDIGFADTPENRKLIWPFTYYD